MLETFPELAQLEALAALTVELKLPKTAPAYWAQQKQKGDTPIDFLKRHYSEWLGKGLSKPDIKRLDPQLYVAIRNWVHRNGMPDDIDLPSLKQQNDRWVQRVQDTHGNGLLPMDPQNFDLVRRFMAASVRRSEGRTKG